MQTLLPFADFDQTARVLDDRRLGLQRMDDLKVLEGLTGYKLFYQDPNVDEWGRRRNIKREVPKWEPRMHPVGWAHRPVVEGWRNYERLLRKYHLAICKEWARRGFEDSLYEKFVFLWDAILTGEDESEPPWLGDPLFHLAHQSYLVSKAPGIYEDLFPGAIEGLEIKWTR